MAYLRNDDVIVHITATDMIVDQLIALAATMAPTTKVPGPDQTPNDQCPYTAIPGHVGMTLGTSGSTMVASGVVVGTTPPPPLIC